MTRHTTTTANVDEHGIEHSPKCERPGVTVKPSTLNGWNLARCQGCKGQRLTRHPVTEAKR